MKIRMNQKTLCKNLNLKTRNFLIIGIQTIWKKIEKVKKIKIKNHKKHGLQKFRWKLEMGCI